MGKDYINFMGLFLEVKNEHILEIINIINKHIYKLPVEEYVELYNELYEYVEELEKEQKCNH